MTREAKIMLSIGAAFVVILIILGFSIQSQTAGPKPVDMSVLIGAVNHRIGPEVARVTLVEFGDYQCPACAQTNPGVRQIVESYKNKPDFNFVVRHFPLPQHQNAPMAAETAEAAGAQGKFWEMHDMIYENQLQWAQAGNPIDIFVSYAQKLGLDVNRLKQEVQAEKYRDIINAGLNDGNIVGVNATPTFFINGVKITGISSLDDLKSRIDTELK